MVGKKELEMKLLKKEVISPAFSMPEYWLPQSNLDLLVPAFFPAIFICYKKPSSFTFEEMVNILKKSLAQTLVPYYPLAGEMVTNDVGEPEIYCNNVGVHFSEAYANVELKELDFHKPDDGIGDKLIPEKVNNGLLTVQATQLKCGGLVLSCRFDHRVADAHAAHLFFKSWVEMAISQPLYQPPLFRRSLLSARHHNHYDSSLHEIYLPLTPTTTQLPDSKTHELEKANHVAVSRLYYIKADRVNEIQAQANIDNVGSENKRTKLESFSAFLWKTIAEGYYSTKAPKFCRLGIVVDGRTRLSKDDENKAKVMAKLFGNLISMPFGEEKIENLKDKPLNLVARTVHGFLTKATTKEHFLDLIDFVEAHRPLPEPMLATIYATQIDREGPAVVVSSGQRFPVTKMDFGWGDPVFVSYYYPWGGEAAYVAPMPSPFANGDWIVYMYMLEELMQIIEAKASHVLKPLTSEYLNI